PEYGPMLARGNADPGVGDVDAPVFPESHALDAYAALLRVTHGVRHVVAQDALEQRRVAAHDDGVVDRAAQLEPLGLRFGRIVVDENPHQIVQAEVPPGGLHDARVQARDVEQDVEHLLQRRDRFADAADHTAGLRALDLRLERGGEQAQRVQ